MLRVGLTGGIGAGKSTVARRLAELGAVVVDADQLAREVVEPGSAGLDAVVQAFGQAVLGPGGGLDRAALGRRVFADPQARQRLNAILHPRIAALTAERVAALPPETVFVHDVPLLVENRMGANYQLVVVVHAPEAERVRRLVDERGMAEQDAQARVAAQVSDQARREAADVWLDNSGPREDLLARIDELWAHRLVPFEVNLRERRAALCPAGVVPAEPDPSWPTQAARLASRVARAADAAGVPVLRVDHHGFTSVPGLVSEDVVDLQLVLTDLDAADRACLALEEAGFLRAPGRWWDKRPDGTARDKRVHTATDPGRAVNLHVRPVDGPVWLETLAFRDWLRANPAEREACAEVTRAAAGTDHVRCPGGTNPWVPAALGRALAWADAVGWAPGPALAGSAAGG